MDYFHVLRTPVLAGRAPYATDFTPGVEPIAFISADIWRTLFNRDRTVIGRPVIVNGTTRVVAGVLDLPASTPGAADLWLPNPQSSSLFSNRRARLFTVLARLRPNASAQSATAELQAIAAGIVRDAPEAGRDMSMRATPLREEIVHPVRSSLLILWGAVGVLTVIAFANVANLLLMDGSVRERELTLRTALGAPRLALIRQLALEAGAIGLVGGIAGAGLGAWGLGLVRRVLPPSLPRASDVHIDPILIVSGIALSVVCATLFALLPAISSSRRDAAAALRAPDATGAKSRLRDALVVAEVALTLVLLFGAGLLGRSLLAAARKPMGFDPHHVSAVDVTLPAGRYGGAAAQERFFSAVLERLSTLRDVEQAAVTGALPLSPTAATTMIVRDAPDDQQPVADVITATPQLFAALRITVVRGRTFKKEDRAGGPPVAVINETAARTMWPAGVDPIGHPIEMRDWGPPYQATVVGIVADVRQAGAERAPAPAIYYPLAQFPQTTLTQTIVIRTRDAAPGLIDAVREAIRRVDPAQPVGSTLSMEARLSAALAPRRFNLLLLAAFASAALLLAGVGIYGVVAFAMAARTREIGIRVALGASPRQIIWLAVARGAAPIAVGLVAGAIGALLASATIEALLFEVASRDWLSLAAAIALIVLGSLASVAPAARRAVTIDPAISCRLP